MSAMKITGHSYWFFLLASIAAVFTVMLACSAGLYSRPDFDEDHKWRVLSMTPLAFITAAVLASPLSLLVYFCLRRKRLAVALPVILILPAVSGFMLTRFASDVGNWGAFVALIVSVLGCTMLPNQFLKPSAVHTTDSATRSASQIGGGLLHGRYASMRVVLNAALLVLLTGCDNGRERFNRDILQHYEVPCHKYYSIYASSDIEGAKKALHDVIELSLAEKSKAKYSKYYWPFDTQIAFAQARLAVIAEHQGQRQEAERLFASASDYMMRGERAMSLDLQMSGSTNDMSNEKAVTPAEWRKAVRKLDADHHVNWDSPNLSPEPSAVGADSSTTRSTPGVGGGSLHGR